MRHLLGLGICMGLSCCLVGLKAQQTDLDNAHNLFASSLFKDAIPLYEKVLARNPHEVLALWRLGECYRFTLNPTKACHWYAQAVAKDSRPEYLYAYGQALKLQGKYAEAKTQFLRLANRDPERGQHFAQTCDFAQKPSEALFAVSNMAKINSKSADFAPTFYRDQLIFASSRSVAVEKEGQVTWTNDAFNQHYVALRDPSTDSVLSVKPLRPSVGRDINDAPMAYTRNGERVAITSNNFMDGIRHINGSGLMMDLYLYDTRAMHEWKTETELFFPHNATVDSEMPYSTGHPAFSPDGKALYFSSNRPGGMGGYDLYVCFRTEQGWTEPRNLGYPINTPGDELSPFVDETGRLFFASDWHPGFGGLDVFTSERFSYGWGSPQNLGPELNSSYDELYFIYDSRRKTGYFSSNRPGGQGFEDIYRAELRKSLPVYVPLLVEAGYRVLYDDQIYDYQNEISEPHSNDWYSLLKILGDNPRSVVQINVHTDSRGLAKNNLELSRRRARNFAEFLHSKGVDRRRILYEGYGDQFLLNQCKPKVVCSEAEHRVNRRTELVFVGHLNDSDQVQITHNASPDPSKNPDALAASQAPPATANPGPRPSNLEPEQLNPNNPGSAAKIYVPEPDNEPAGRSNPPTAATNPAPVKKGPKASYKIGEMLDFVLVSYAHDKAEVNVAKSQGLKDLVKLLKDQPKLKLEIGSHTDSKGTSQYNLKLSQERADAMKRYLIREGIAPDRLIAKGYGESKLLNYCKDGVRCSDAQHAQNRRTEFKVIGADAPVAKPAAEPSKTETKPAASTAKAGNYKVGDLIKVSEIQYEFDKDKIDLKRSQGLKEIVQILKSSSLAVEIGSHTDSRGSTDYNLKLSQRRAKAVYTYLLSQGIAAKRLSYKGYGESKLVNRCKDGVNCADEEHAQNRRTEFKVTALK